MTVGPLYSFLSLRPKSKILPTSLIRGRLWRGDNLHLARYTRHMYRSAPLYSPVNTQRYLARVGYLSVMGLKEIFSLYDSEPLMYNVGKGVGAMGMRENLDFMKEYNALDQILKDMYPSEDKSISGVFRYTSRMRELALRGRMWIPNWTEDLTRLDELRRCRNQMVHMDGFERNCFTQEDVAWITAFHMRILNQTDPIAMLRKHATERNCSKADPNQIPTTGGSARVKPTRNQSAAPAIIAICVIFAVLAAALYLLLY